MRLKTLLFTLFGICFSTGLTAQNLYDVSTAYLTNNGFDDHFDYAIGETGNVAQEIKDVYSWTKDIAVNYTITGVYQIGTAKTFNGTSIPSVGYDGTSNGGVLALSTGWSQAMKFYQTVTLPAGTYTLASAFFNGSDQTVGASIVGWIPNTGVSKISTIGSFPIKAWTPDSITFTITEETTGKIQVGFLSTQSAGSGVHAKVVLDYVKLLRTTPIGTADVDLKKKVLAGDIAKAITLLASGTGSSVDVFKAVIDEAQAVYDSNATTISEIYAEQDKLAAATDVFLWANPTGDKPTVITNKRYARGATMAFGRISVTGTNVTEQGICWSTNSEPTINDNRVTNFIDNNGAIYWIKNLQPSTKYYMRGYAITGGRQVAYGDVLKFYTIPRGTMSYTMRTDGDAAALARINSAMNSAVNWWNNLTSIQGVSFNVGYNSGTPTADCSYGGYIRVGPNSSYQRTGTMLHEMEHGVGVGTQDVYWFNELRTNGDRGYWLGDRATDVLRFWDNDDNARINGDTQHFWPYGINGASEDNGTDELYIAQSLIVQGFGEDGLPAPADFATPAYTFDQEDNVKYYLKNESEDCGLYTSYLIEADQGKVMLRMMTNEEATANDSVAWKVTFNPVRSFYAFQNVATGHYLTYMVANSGMAATTSSSPGVNNLFHLMRSRVNAMDASDLRGYWIIHNDRSKTPNTMTAKDASSVINSTFNLSNGAKSQRWLILTQDEMGKMESAAKAAFGKQFTDYIEQIRKLRNTPHSEDVAGTDAELDSQISSLEAQNTTATTAIQVSELVNRAKVAGFNFLAAATPLSTTQPFDITFMIKNPGMDNTAGWVGSPTLNYSCAEYYMTTFDFGQTISQIPAGTYQLKVQAFQRPGSSAQAYSDYVANINMVSTFIYAGSKSQKVVNAVSEAQLAKVGVGTESTLASTPSTYIPNNMQSASAYFGKGYYDNEVFTELATDSSDLKIGIRCGSSSDMYWTIFDNFRLYYYGSMKADVVSGIKNLPLNTVNQADKSSFDIYSIDGRLLRRNAINLDGLSHGLYIINGKKVIL